MVNCSVFCPTPSLSAMVVNRFGLRADTITYNLGGMGCSAGLLSVSLARELLQVTPANLSGSHDRVFLARRVQDCMGSAREKFGWIQNSFDSLSMCCVGWSL